MLGMVDHELGDRSNNYLNDITGIWKNTFSNTGRHGSSTGGIDNSMMSQIRSKDEKAIREKFVSKNIPF